MKRTTVAASASIILGGALVAAAAPPKCTAPAEWFPPGNIKEPDFKAPDLARNCEFHQWAWRTFLWLTQPTGDGDCIRLLDLPTADDLFMPGRGPVAFKSLPKGRVLVLRPRVGKMAGPTHFGEITQAGSRGILVDRNGRAVYYASHFNAEFYQFVRDNNLFTQDGYKQFDKDRPFPVKALEIKSAWRIVDPHENPKGFYVTKARLSPLTCGNGKDACEGDDIKMDLNPAPQEVSVALIGLHVVGRVEEHPEFIWSTFEHDDNAPDLPANLGPDSPDPVSNRDYTFYKAGVPAKSCNDRQKGTIELDKKAQTLKQVTNVFRQDTLSDGDDANRQNVKDLNDAVHAGLAKSDKTSPWLRYSLVGALWFKVKDGLKPEMNDSDMQALATGSTKLANATMETFAQKTTTNCFSCHYTNFFDPPKNINLSHILVARVLQREEANKLVARKLVKLPARLGSFKEVQDLLNDFVAANDVPIGLTPYKDFWDRTPDGPMTYDKFLGGDIPGVADPATGKPLKILIRKDSAHSNLILGLRGEKGTLFDPDTGTVGRIPLTGPFLPDDEIDRLAKWIDAGCPDGS